MNVHIWDVAFNGYVILFVCLFCGYETIFARDTENLLFDLVMVNVITQIDQKSGGAETSSK